VFSDCGPSSKSAFGEACGRSNMSCFPRLDRLTCSELFCRWGVIGTSFSIPIIIKASVSRSSLLAPVLLNTRLDCYDQIKSFQMLGFRRLWYPHRERSRSITHPACLAHEPVSTPRPFSREFQRTGKPDSLMPYSHC